MYETSVANPPPNHQYEAEPARCRLCGVEPALVCDPLDSGLCFGCYCQVRAEMADAWAEHDALTDAEQAALDAGMDAEWLRHFGEAGAA